MPRSAGRGRGYVKKGEESGRRGLVPAAQPGRENKGCKNFLLESKMNLFACPRRRRGHN
nr:MAG TPA: hypothetical protein [Caudoviricetes sp.]